MQHLLSMTRLCILVVFVMSVCYGSASPLQRIHCDTGGLKDECVSCLCKTGSTINCSPKPCADNQFPERRKRQVEVAAENVIAGITEAPPTASTTTEAQQIENSTTSSNVITPSAAVLPASEVVPSLPPPPHPSAAQATAVKPRSCKSGSTWEEECNTCWCLDNGMAACTVKRCEVVSPLAAAKTASSTTVLPTETAPSTSVLPPVASGTPQTPSVQSQTPSVQSQTPSVLPPATPVKSATTSEPTSPSVSVSSTSPSGGTS